MPRAALYAFETSAGSAAGGREGTLLPGKAATSAKALPALASIPPLAVTGAALEGADMVNRRGRIKGEMVWKGERFF